MLADVTAHQTSTAIFFLFLDVETVSHETLPQSVHKYPVAYRF